MSRKTAGPYSAAKAPCAMRTTRFDYTMFVSVRIRIPPADPRNRFAVR